MSPCAPEPCKRAPTRFTQRWRGARLACDTTCRVLPGAQGRTEARWRPGAHRGRIASERWRSWPKFHLMRTSCRVACVCVCAACGSCIQLLPGAGFCALQVAQSRIRAQRRLRRVVQRLPSHDEPHVSPPLIRAALVVHRRPATQRGCADMSCRRGRYERQWCSSVLAEYQGLYLDDVSWCTLCDRARRV